MSSLQAQTSKDTATAQDTSLLHLAAVMLRHNPPVFRANPAIRHPQASESRADAFFAGKNYNAALNAAIQSAELYIRASRSAPTAAEKAKLDQKCAAIIAKAELWKKKQKSGAAAAEPEPKLSSSSSAPSPSKRPAPRSTNKQSTKEKLLLLQSSKINGGVFPPWQGPPEATEFLNNGAPFL
jgi:hypothetical protein